MVGRTDCTCTSTGRTDDRALIGIRASVWGPSDALTSTVCRLGVLGNLDMPTIGVDGEHMVAKKKNLNNVIAKPAHMGSGFQHQAGAGPPR